MASMDITPQELRDIEIREAWRGYHRDDVDELLERAAATIEHLEAENSQLRARLQSAPAPARPTAAPVAPQPAAPAVPAAPPAPAAPVRTPDTDVIQRTLVLAQKAADDAVAEAKAKAGQIVAESQAQATQLVAEAEEQARRIADAETARLEADIAKLQSARESLTADVDALERFEAEYRDRLRRAIQAELDLLEASVGAPGARPGLSEVDAGVAARPAKEPAAPGPSWSASQEGVVAPPAATGGPPTVHIEAVPAYGASEPEPAWDPAPAGGWGETPTAAVVEDGGDFPADDEHIEHDSLDDDEFFASLREAVRDDAPLGGGGEDETAYFDADDTDEHRRLFKRRR